MPKYEIRVPVSYSGYEFYQVEADDPEAAIEVAKAGEHGPFDEDLSCDSTEWDEASVDEV